MGTNLIFFRLFDTAVQQLRERFGDNVGLIKYRSVEQILLPGTVDDDVLAPYTELDISDLKLQLQLFRRKRPTTSVDETASALRAMIQKTRCEYWGWRSWSVYCLCAHAASSAEAERSFSALRRLKTWLRSTKKQTV